MSKTSNNQIDYTTALKKTIFDNYSQHSKTCSDLLREDFRAGSAAFKEAFGDNTHHSIEDITSKWNTYVRNNPDAKVESVPLSSKVHHLEILCKLTGLTPNQVFQVVEDPLPKNMVLFTRDETIALCRVLAQADLYNRDAITKIFCGNQCFSRGKGGYMFSVKLQESPFYSVCLALVVHKTPTEHEHSRDNHVKFSFHVFDYSHVSIPSSDDSIPFEAKTPVIPSEMEENNCVCFEYSELLLELIDNANITRKKLSSEEKNKGNQDLEKQWKLFEKNIRDSYMTALGEYDTQTTPLEEAPHLSITLRDVFETINKDSATDNDLSENITKVLSSNYFQFIPPPQEKDEEEDTVDNVLAAATQRNKRTK